MAYNNVRLLSKDNKTRIFIDDVEIKWVSGFELRRYAGQDQTTISIEFACDLNTTERKKDRVLIDKREYEELQKLAKPLQEWLLKHYNVMCSIRVDSERAAIVSDEVSVPFGDE